MSCLGWILLIFIVMPVINLVIMMATEKSGPTSTWLPPNARPPRDK